MPHCLLLNEMSLAADSLLLLLVCFSIEIGMMLNRTVNKRLSIYTPSPIHTHLFKLRIHNSCLILHYTTHGL